MSYVWYQTADVLCQASHVFCLMSDVWYQMSDIICLISDVWCLMSRLLSDIWCLMTTSYVICLMSNVRCLMFVWCHQMSDDRRLMSYVWYQTSDGRRLLLMYDVRWLILFVWSQMSGVRYLMSDIRCHFYTRILSGTKIEISRVGDFVRSYYQPLGFFFLSFDYILFQSFLPLTLPSFTPIGLKLGGRVLSYINYIGMPVATCLGLESGMSSAL